MNDFLIKSAISAIVLLAAYYLFLEREKMHRFNRFYLLGSIVVSLVIPFISIEIIQTIEMPAMPTPMPFQMTAPIEEEIDFTPYVIAGIYAVVTLFFTIRFGRNLSKIIRKEKSAEKISYKNATLALVDENTLPHTFGNTIFINKTDYENRNIEEELYLHELTHVTQKHTWDIIFIEIVKTIFWFNPIFIFYKKAIQLNHEFLADEKVVKARNDVPFYQKLLLSKTNYPEIELASSLNYSLTKKRLIMMTKTTSATAALLRKMMIVPLLSGLIFFLCTETVAQQKQPTKANQSPEAKADYRKKQDEYFAGTRIIAYKSGVMTTLGKTEGKDIVLDKRYEDLTEDEHKKYEPMLIVREPLQKKSPTKQELDGFKNAKKYAIWIDEKNVPNSELSKYKPIEIAYFSGSVILKNARTKKHPQPFQYWFYTQSYFDEHDIGKREKIRRRQNRNI
ncbi:M56 family metallopeptidase [Flavobacterium sp. 3HN19-14]|uniref:M56 family metallopeptidase n=1 Tax=Flavobacterium sp. 3HN19-14 TaxID=3448133 RepID=UPI003EE36B96